MKALQVIHACCLDLEYKTTSIYIHSYNMYILLTKHITKSCIQLYMFLGHSSKINYSPLHGIRIAWFFFLEQKPWWKKYKDMDIINFIIHNVQTRSLEYMYGFDELFTKIESKRYSLLKNFKWYQSITINFSETKTRILLKTHTHNVFLQKGGINASRNWLLI